MSALDGNVTDRVAALHHKMFEGPGLSLQLYPCPGAAITLDGQSAVLLRQDSSELWTALYLTGCVIRRVPRPAFFVEEVFREPAYFGPELEDCHEREVHELADTKAAKPENFLDLIKDALSSCGGPFAPDLTDASLDLLEAVMMGLFSEDIEQLQHALQACARVDEALTVLRLAGYRCSWLHRARAAPE